MEKKVIILILTFVFALILCETASAANNQPINVTVGKNTTISNPEDFNYHAVIYDSWSNQPNLAQNRNAVSEKNVANVIITANPGEGGSCQAVTGITINWISNKTWDEIKDYRFKITADVSYNMGAFWSDSDNGASNAGLYMPNLLVDRDINGIIVDPYPNPGVNCINWVGYTYTNTKGEINDRFIQTLTTTYGNPITVGNTGFIAISPIVFASTPSKSQTTTSAYVFATINSIKIEFLPVPVINVFKVRMLSPNVLGVGVVVDNPSWTSDSTVSKVKFLGVINGESISKSFDISKYFLFGRANIGLDVNKNVVNSTFLKIDLKDLGIPRITKDIQFNLTVIAYADNVPSEENKTLVEIFLPVILVHGFNSNPSCWNTMINNLNKQGMTYYTFNYAPGLDDPYYTAIYKFKPWFNQMYKATVYGKFNIVCHSMGALVTRFWLQGMTENNGNTNAKYVDKWIGIGPVNSGAAVMDVWSNPKNAKYSQITKNKKYMILLKGINLIAPMNSQAAKNMRTTDPEIVKLNRKTLPSGVKYLVIVGYNGHEITGVDTVEKPPNNQPYRFTLNGDGVVANTQSKLPGVRTTYINGAKHTGLPSNNLVINTILSTLKN